MRLPVLSSLMNEVNDDPARVRGGTGPLASHPFSGFDPVDDGPRLESCVRRGRLEGREVVHCFLRTVDRGGNVTDSISFGPDENGGPDKKAREPVRCETVRSSISSREWDVIRNVYRNTCANNAFELLHNDCCTCAASALDAVHAPVPKYVVDANRD